MRLASLKFGAFLILVGVLMAALSLKSYFASSALENDGVEVMAEVVRIDSKERSHYLRVELPNPEKSRSSIRVPREDVKKYKVGDKVKVVYLPDKPRDCFLGGKESVSGGGGSTFVYVLLGICIAVGGFFWISRNGFRD